jgi:predicted O-methyltransferase YrrM
MAHPSDEGFQAGDRPMSKELYAAIGAFLDETLVGSDPVLDAVQESCREADLPTISVVPTYGKFLNLLARMLSARTILEIGTLAGYSTIWLARALPANGRLVTLESDPKHAAIARTNFRRAGLADLIDLREGIAVETLPGVAADHASGFDLIFIDADKPSNPTYFTWALKLSHPGSLILMDNVIRDGRILESDSTDPSIQSRRRLFTLIANEPRVSGTALQMVDAKGHDGFAMALVL